MFEFKDPKQNSPFGSYTAHGLSVFCFKKELENVKIFPFKTNQEIHFSWHQQNWVQVAINRASLHKQSILNYLLDIRLIVCQSDVATMTTHF